MVWGNSSAKESGCLPIYDGARNSGLHQQIQQDEQNMDPQREAQQLGTTKKATTQVNLPKNDRSFAFHNGQVNIENSMGDHTRRSLRTD